MIHLLHWMLWPRQKIDRISACGDPLGKVISVLVLVASTLCCSYCAMAASERNTQPIRIAAASSLQFVLNDLVDIFHKQSKLPRPQLVYG